MSVEQDAPIGELFDDLADIYIEVREAVGWDPWPHVDEVLGAEVSLEGLSILDVGCGSGEVALGLVARGAEVTGVDASAKMCELAAEAVPEARFIVRDLGAGLPFEDGSFDAVIALGCVEYVADIEGACAELVRVVKPGGLVLYVIERCEEGLCGGEARTFRLYESWTRHRRPHEEIAEVAERLLDDVQLDRVPAYVFDDTGEQVGYVRVIGRARQARRS